ncbi:MAG TPA: protein kinase [Candidatus Acidoferrales bacterium]|nr:protein kinase [Candidatus Acidoferrales bacterium]
MIGKALSHYRIAAEIGRGGMGVVYRAHDELLKRDVALKLLREDVVGHADLRTRVLAEARAACALSHPAITTIYDVAEEDGRLFIVMELVQGETLRVRLSGAGMLEPRAVARLGSQIAEALDAAHSRGVVHGDIKPENIMLLPDGRPKILDFGISRQIVEDTLAQTRSMNDVPPAVSSSIGGTLAYMAPELLRNEAGSAQTDLYALGVVLFELAAGHRPFGGRTSAALIPQILHDSAPRLSDVRSGVPAELARVVQKLLQKDPQVRYQSSRDLHVDLANLQRELELGSILPAAVLGKRAVAVLPFKLLTPDVENEYLGVALADAIINHLGRSGEVLVRPTNTVRRYANDEVDPLLAARELNVGVIVDGSVQKSGSRVRVHVQAWNAPDGTTLLTGKYESETSELFDLEDKVSEALARALGLQSLAQAPMPLGPPTKNTRAYELFMRAVERLSRVNKWDMRTAIEMLEDATKMDPGFSEAWARLAEACVFMGATFDPTPRWYKKAETALRRALALDPTNAEAHCAHGRVLWTPIHGYKNREALIALSESLRRSPGYHPALVWKYLIFLHVGILEEAVTGLSEALAAHPEDGFVLTFLAQAWMMRGNYDEAQEYFKRALQLDPASLWANLFSPMVSLYGRNPEGAVEVIKNASQLFPGEPLLTSWEGLLWAKRGEPRKAEKLVRKALGVGKSMLHTHHTWHTAAAVYATIGKPSLAVPLLARAGRSGLPNYPLFRDDPHFQSLKSYAPFRRLLAALKKETDGYRREFVRS